MNNLQVIEKESIDHLSKFICLASQHHGAQYIISAGENQGVDKKILENLANMKKNAYIVHLDYGDINNFIEMHPDTVGTSTLILFRPPSGDIKHDFEAILKLAPVNIMLVYDMNGKYGSKMLHHFLAKHNLSKLISTIDPKKIYGGHPYYPELNNYAMVNDCGVCKSFVNDIDICIHTTIWLRYVSPSNNGINQPRAKQYEDYFTGKYNYDSRNEHYIIIKWISQQIKKFDPKFPVISVGSGNGTVERDLKLRTKKFNIICIDPAPESFRKFPHDKNRCIKPSYPYTKDLVKANPDIVGNCYLLLYWPYTDETTYDIEALIELNPKHVIMFFDTNGSAAGYTMHHYMFNFGLSRLSREKLPDPKIKFGSHPHFPKLFEYKCIEKISWENTIENTWMGISHKVDRCLTIVVLNRQ